ncbi:MAG: quinone-dependent dihydroorotate dehydrogenase [Candidatus Levyibacteriota bacterium]
MDLYSNIIRPVLFKTNPDHLHETIILLGSILGKTSITRSLLKLTYRYENSVLETKVFGINFKNPIGIAGGFDKNAKLIQVLPSIGFGFVEVGSITARPYKGNPRPWNVRLKQDQSLIVNYGLKNQGVDKIKKRIKNQKRTTPLIINIAKTNDIRIRGDASVEDYNKTFVKLQSIADIINLNISCPNTGDGQLFCENPELLDNLLKRVSKNRVKKPVVLKLKPDLSDEMLDKIVEVSIRYPIIKGFIIANLTRDRNLLKKTKPKNISQFNGGISGKPTKEQSNKMIKTIYKKTKGKYPIIGLGGVFTAEDAYEKICLGASLVELVTGLIYGGPETIKNINKGLVKLLQKDGFSNISQAVGSKNKI